MKMKELKTLAAKIAKCEQTIANSDDPRVIHQAEDEIMRLSRCVDSLADIMQIDELVMKILEKN